MIPYHVYLSLPGICVLSTPTFLSLLRPLPFRSRLFSNGTSSSSVRGDSVLGSLILTHSDVYLPFTTLSTLTFLPNPSTMDFRTKESPPFVPVNSFVSFCLPFW